MGARPCRDGRGRTPYRPITLLFAWRQFRILHANDASVGASHPCLTKTKGEGIMAAIIKQRTKIKELRKPFKIPIDVLAELDIYAEFLNERKDFVVTEGLRACFKSDAGFKEFLAKPEQQKRLEQVQTSLASAKRQNRTVVMQPVA